MPPDLLRAAAFAMLACGASWSAQSLAAPPSPAVGEAAPSGAVEAVAAALCGRNADQGLMLRAAAFDSPNLDSLPRAWRRARAEDLEIWLAAPFCLEATSEETKLFAKRQQALESLQERVGRARTTEAIAADIAGLAKRQPGDIGTGEWPDAPVCRHCPALRAAEVAIAGLAKSPWPNAKGEQALLEKRLAAAEMREPLIRQLCAFKPPPGARAEIEQRFRYYSWTAEGAWLLQVAELFEQPRIATWCSRQ
jgi:hypothetical protein